MKGESGALDLNRIKELIDKWGSGLKAGLDKDHAEREKAYFREKLAEVKEADGKDLFLPVIPLEPGKESSDFTEAGWYQQDLKGNWILQVGEMDRYDPDSEGALARVWIERNGKPRGVLFGSEDRSVPGRRFKGETTADVVKQIDDVVREKMTQPSSEDTAADLGRPGELTGEDYSLMSSAERTARAALDLPPGLKNFLAGEAGASPLPEVLARAWKATTDTARDVMDALGKWAGKQVPKTTRADRLSGEALARLHAAPGHVKVLTPLMIDKVLGADATEAEDLMAGAIGTEWQLRHTRQSYLGEALRQDGLAATARQQAAAAVDPVAKAQYLAQAREAADNSTASLKIMHDVKSVIGAKGSPLDTFDKYQKGLDSSWFQKILANWKEHMVPVMEDNFRRAKGLEDTDPINSPTQVPGYPMNLKGVQEGDPATDSTVFIGEPRQGNLQNLRIRKSPFDNQRKGDADGYDMKMSAMIENTLRRGTVLAAKAEFARTLVERGQGEWGPSEGPGSHVVHDGVPAVKFPEVKPPKGTQDAEAGETALFVYDKGAASEFRKALQLDKTPEWHDASRVVTGLFTRANLVSFFEAISHGINLGTAQFKPGMNPFRTINYIYKIMTSDPATRDRIVGLARMGAMKSSPEMEGTGMKGVLWGGKTDPTAWVSSALDVMQRATRLALDDAFTYLAKPKWYAPQGRVVDTETNRRDFINQAGNYTLTSQSNLVQWLRSTGLGPFAVASTNFTAQGVRAMIGDPGVTATSPMQAVGLRAEYFFKAVVAAVGAAAMVNYFKSGKAFPENTKLGEINVGKDAQGNDQVYDLLQLTGARRGMRLTGVDAATEGTRVGKKPGKTVDAWKRDAMHSLLHIAEGPAVQFGHTALTGENALGIFISKKLTQDQRNAGGSQFKEDLWTAIKNINGPIAIAAGADRPDKPFDATRWKRLGGAIMPKERKAGALRR